MCVRVRAYLLSSISNASNRRWSSNCYHMTSYPSHLNQASLLKSPVKANEFSICIWACRHGYQKKNVLPYWVARALGERTISLNGKNLHVCCSHDGGGGGENGETDMCVCVHKCVCVRPGIFLWYPTKSHTTVENRVHSVAKIHPLRGKAACSRWIIVESKRAHTHSLLLTTFLINFLFFVVI